MATNQIFDNLLTEISSEVLEKVQTQLNTVISKAVRERMDFLTAEDLDRTISNEYIETEVKNKIDKLVENFKPDLSVVEANIQSLTAYWVDTVKNDINSRVNIIITDKINEFDFTSAILTRIEKNLDPKTRKYGKEQAVLYFRAPCIWNHFRDLTT